MRRCHFKNGGATTNGKGQGVAEEETRVKHVENVSYAVWVFIVTFHLLYKLDFLACLFSHCVP